jgi:superfamily II DNA/RNA helicase
MFEDVAGLEVTPEMQRGFERDGIAEPTPVQRAVIPAILEGRHVVIESGTGPGKTLAYLLPVLQKLRREPAARAVCLAPAAELAVQTLRVADRYKAPDVRGVALVSGGSQRQQKTRLQKSTQLMVGTPGRVLELFEQRKLKGVTTLVLDEVEPILTSKEADYLREVISRPEPRLQLVLAAATFGVRSEAWIRELMGDAAVRPRLDDSPLQELIEHRMLWIGSESDRDFELTRCIKKSTGQRCIVFVNSPNLIRHLYRVLLERGLKPVSVSAERSKLQNRQALLDFAGSKAKVLLTTERAATGLDIPDVPRVFHYELPGSAQAYVHRAGRTGRAGQSGQSIVLVGAGERARVEKMASELGITLSPLEA